MARTPLFLRIEALARHSAAQHPPSGVSRRSVLAGAAASMLAGMARPARAGATAPRIVIIGAGIAGLTAALALQDAGYGCTVFEASNRVGGRMESDSTTWQNHQVSEHCGELIDTGHVLMQVLAQRFHLPLADLHAAEPAGSTDTYYFGGAYYPQAQAQADFGAVWDALQSDLNAAGYPTTFFNQTPEGAALDAMSVFDWIESRVPGGHGSKLGQLLDIAYDEEFGAPTTGQSALNIVYLLGYQTDPAQFEMFGQSDERFHIAGGNERLPQAMKNAIEAAAPGTIRTNAALTAIQQRFGGGYKLGIAHNGQTYVVEADHVILALPFSVLRHLDLSQAGFTKRKLQAIQQLGYGSNVKLQLQFASRPWNSAGPWGISSGTSFTDNGYGNAWDVTRAQRGDTGILVNYLGSAGAVVPADPPSAAVTQAMARQFLRQIEPVFPGISGEWNGLATVSAPLRDPWRRGSYAYWKVGQYTSIAGAERMRSRTCHFAGEHCSVNFQGYMEGGAQEGLRAAQDVLADLQK
jgi:monoamine oxidase